MVGRTERRLAATRYIEGLLIPGQRKSIEPMAERLGVDAQSLQQFVTVTGRNNCPVRRHDNSRQDFRIRVIQTGQ